MKISFRKVSKIINTDNLKNFSQFNSDKSKE